MKKQLNLIIMTLLAVVTLVSCSDSVTYADMKKKETQRHKQIHLKPKDTKDI